MKEIAVRNKFLKPMLNAILDGSIKNKNAPKGISLKRTAKDQFHFYISNAQGVPLATICDLRLEVGETFTVIDVERLFELSILESP